MNLLRNRVWFIYSLAIVISACGDAADDDKDTDSAGGPSDAGVDSGVGDSDTTPQEADTEILIDGVAAILPLEDFDDGDIENEIYGTWLAYDDRIDNGNAVVSPESIFEGGVFEADAPGFGGGLAAHVTGTTGNVLGWDYLGFLTSMHPDALCPKAVPTEIDLSEYDGVQFMVKGSVTTGAMIFKIPHKKDGEEGNCTTEGGVAADSLTAYCDYEIDFKAELTDTWSLIRIRFEDLAQPDWGEAVALSDVLAHAKELVWEYKAQNGELDFWLDNLALFKDEPGPDDLYPRVVVESTDKLELVDNPDDPAAGSVTDISVDDQSFETAKEIEVDAEPEMLWDVLAAAYNETLIKTEDLLHVEFQAKCITPPEGEDTCRMSFHFLQAEEPYTRSVLLPITVGNEWTSFSYPFLSVEKYEPEEAQAILMLGYPAQTVAIGGFVITNYGDTKDIEDLSKTEITYEGRDTDATWREAAAERIETHRKGDLVVKVTDADGAPISDADVSIEMTKHHFGFGTSLNADSQKNILVGNDLEQYETSIPELFNTVVLENTLKWTALAGDWGDHMGMDLAEWALDWTEERDLQVRGHVLVWPGWNNLPSSLKSGYDTALSDNGEEAAAEWLKSEVETHVRETAEALAGRLSHWDVLNEPFDNHDLMDILGEAAMAEWFRIAREADPDAKLFINDYSILNRKTTNSASRDNLLRIVSALVDDDAPIDGIGFQAHFEEDLTAPEQVLDILEQFAVFDKELWITEFDMPDLAPDLAADYLRDFMTILFSHPLAGGFIMWGFWDGNHFGPSAPIYDDDWTEKPSGKTYRDLVFDEWWTEEQGKTDDDGEFGTRAFFGDYTVTVTVDGDTVTEDVSFAPGSLTVEISL